MISLSLAANAAFTNDCKKNMKTGISSHQSVAVIKNEWLTPPYILRALGRFDLDPCAPVSRPWQTAVNHFTIEDNGLLQNWFGRVWLNPPYGAQTHEWLSKLVNHGNGGAPSVLVAYGERNARALKNSGLAGQFIQLNNNHTSHGMNQKQSPDVYDEPPVVRLAKMIWDYVTLPMIFVCLLFELLQNLYTSKNQKTKSIMTTIKITQKGADIFADDADSHSLVVINGIQYNAVDDTETEAACACCALLTQDCQSIRCGADERADVRDVHFKPAQP